MPTTEHDVFVNRWGEAIPLDPRHSKGALAVSGAGYTHRWDEASPDDKVLAYLREATDRVRLGVHMLDLFGGSVVGRDVLVIGASDGAETALLAAMGSARVVGTDYGDPFTASTSINPRRDHLLAVARRHRESLGFPAAAIEPSFLLDDITRSTLPDASFDLAVSWQTLEHIPDPAAAMRTLARVLRPGGLAYHEYNPFFAIDGGHSLCTLATPWGHVRLDAQDMERYLRQMRPDVADDALAFYRSALNRMTHADLLAAAGDAGLETLAFVPRSRTEDLLLLTPQMWTQARRNYPALTVNDLACRIVRIVLRRPA